MNQLQRRVVDLAEVEIEQALAEHDGNIAASAKLLGCDRTQLNRRVKESDSLSKFRDAAVDLKDVLRVEQSLNVIDRALGGAKDMTKSELTAAIFTLKCKGGWNEKQEITGKDGGPLAMVIAPVRNLNAEDWKRENQKT